MLLSTTNEDTHYYIEGMRELGAVYILSQFHSKKVMEQFTRQIPVQITMTARKLFSNQKYHIDIESIFLLILTYAQYLIVKLIVFKLSSNLFNQYD